jgi:predicted alpha/beta hydrolase family esterase
MTQHLLFIQGAGQGAYEEDKELVANLRAELGPEYAVHYPAMPDEDDASYTEWSQRIANDVAEMQVPIILAGHSVGASVLIKWLSERRTDTPIAGVFLIATPFWGGDGWQYEGYEELMLPTGFAARLPKGMAVFLYHCRDDEIVPFDHLALYAQVLPQATVREFSAGGHQFNIHLSEVANDIRTLRS